MTSGPIYHPVDCCGEHHNLPDEGGYECSAYPGAIYIGIAPEPYRDGASAEADYLTRTYHNARRYDEHARAAFCESALGAMGRCVEQP